MILKIMNPKSLVVRSCTPFCVFQREFIFLCRRQVVIRDGSLFWQGGRISPIELRKKKLVFIDWYFLLPYWTFVPYRTLRKVKMTWRNHQHGHRHFYSESVATTHRKGTDFSKIKVRITFVSRIVRVEHITPFIICIEIPVLAVPTVMCNPCAPVLPVNSTIILFPCLQPRWPWHDRST